jgi:hypothetical protein
MSLRTSLALSAALIAISGCCGARSAPATRPATRSPAQPSSATILPDPAAQEARQASIASDARSLAAEVDRAAGGDWDAWQRQTAPHRAALQGRLEALWRADLTEVPKNLVAVNQFEPLVPVDRFPYFATFAKETNHYLVDDDYLDRGARVIADAARWLSARRIQLVYVSCPVLVEIYPEHFLPDVPKDGIIAPHVRHLVGKLLAADVEVIDPTPALRTYTGKAPLYRPDDCHWAAAGVGVTAEMVADRLRGRDERLRVAYQPDSPRVVAESGTREILPSGRPSMTPAQRALADTVAGKDVWPDIKDWQDGASPILVFGDSYARQFPEALAFALNMPVRQGPIGPGPTQAWQTLVSEPDQLAGVRIVVWVQCRLYWPAMKPHGDR